MRFNNILRRALNLHSAGTGTFTPAGERRFELGPGEDNGRRRAGTFDRLGKLCVEGQEVATYLFQVPDDVAEWQRVGAIIEAILRETARSGRREMPLIAKQMRQALRAGPSVTVTEQLITGFDRLIALSLAARSGID